MPLLLLLIGWLGATSAMADGKTKAVHICQELILRGAWTPEDIMTTFNVEVSSYFDTELDGCARKLAIGYATTDNKQSTLYIEQMAETPIAIWPLGRRLLTIWESGSAFWVSVYANDGLNVTKVLDIRPKAMPEIVFSKTGEERLIFSHYSAASGSAEGVIYSAPMLSDVYLWADGRYKKKTDIPWADRLNYLK